MPELIKYFLSGVCLLGLAALVSAQDTLIEISSQIAARVRLYFVGMFVGNLSPDKQHQKCQR